MSVSFPSCCHYIPFASQLLTTVVAYWEHLACQVEKIVTALISRMFYNGYLRAPEPLSQQRTQALIDEKSAYPLECESLEGKSIEVLYIPSHLPQRTGNALIFANNSTYQKVHPRHWVHYWNKGADIVLWNPTAPTGSELTINQYAQELISVIGVLLAEKPDQHLAIKSYCASVEPSIAAAAHFRNHQISLIVDRGQCNVHALAASQTLLAKLPYIRNILENAFSCKGLQKLNEIAGRILFTSPPAGQDQIMHYEWVQNLTRQLYLQRNREDDVYIELEENSDHWSEWSAQTHNQVYSFLKENGIISPDYTPASQAEFPTPPQLSYFKTTLLPILIKSPIDHLKGLITFLQSEQH